MRRAWSLGALVVAYMAAAGCGDSNEDEAYTPVVEWKACPSPFNQMDECSTLKMPYDWGNVDGEKLDVFVARKKAAGVARGQVWLLQGGPGATGAVFAARFGNEQTEVERIAEAVPDVDIYVIEHRGVGLSTRLTCPRQPGADGPPDGLEECINALKVSWGPKLPYFTSQAAARDLAAAIDATRVSGQKPFVYGVSYGTYWAIQYLKVRPNDAAGVILDSIAPPGELFFNEFTLQFDPVAEKLSALCAADALCAQKLGPDPWARVRSIMAGVAQGRCMDELNTKTSGSFASDTENYVRRVKGAFASLLQQSSINTLLFPVLYRLERCDAADLEPLYQFFLLADSILSSDEASLPGGPGWVERATRNGSVGEASVADEVNALRSNLLRYHIGGSELYAPASLSRAEIERRCDDALFCPAPTIDVYLREVWPYYTPPADVWAWPGTNVPILAMNGELDPQTPVETAARVEANFRNSTQNFVRVPFATHALISSSTLHSDHNETCGNQMLYAFLRDPAAPPATECLSDLEASSFVSGPDASLYTPDFVQVFFGPETSDLWENTTPAEPLPVASPRTVALPSVATARKLGPVRPMVPWLGEGPSPFAAKP